MPRHSRPSDQGAARAPDHPSHRWSFGGRRSRSVDIPQKLAVFCLDPSAVGSASPAPKQAGEPRRRGRSLIRYKRRMAASPPGRSASRDSSSGPTATEISTAALAHLNTLGFTEEEMSRIAAAATAAHADSTQVVYAHAWHRWSTWARTRGLQELPADPAAVCAYLTERASQGVSRSTINVACSAVGHQHRIHGLDNPITQARVRQVRRGLRRTLGTAPPAVSPEHSTAPTSDASSPQSTSTPLPACATP